MPDVMDVKMTLEDTMLKAGYAESSVLQQSQAVGSLRKNTRMQEALAKAGFTEDVIAENIVEGIKAEKPSWSMTLWKQHPTTPPVTSS